MENPTKTPKKEKSRGKTFLQKEIDLLVKLCKKYYATIENKQTDAVTWRTKQECWESIAGIVCIRTSAQLHNKWNLLKKTARKEFAEERRNVMGTGGGEFKVPIISDISKKIHELNAEAIEGGRNRFDSDAIEVEAIAGCSYETQSVELHSPGSIEGCELGKHDEMLDVDLEDIELEKENIENTWAHSTPASLKRPKHPSLDVGSTPVKKRLLVSSSKNVVKTHEEMVKAKLEVAAIQKEYFKKLVDIQILEEQNKKEQHEWLREEHELKMKILKEELKLKEKALI